MASQPQAGPSTQGTAASVEGPAYRATEQRCVALVDWWLVRGEDDKIRVAGYPERRLLSGGVCGKQTRSSEASLNRAARLFCSGSITMRHADGTLETADHKILLIRGPLNIQQMHSNGFPYEVSKYFRLGFPVQWERYANPNMKQMNGNTQSPSKSTRYYIEKFLHGSFINSEEYNCTEVNSKSSKGPTGSTDEPPSQGLSKFSNGKPRIQAPSCNSGDHAMSKITPSEGLCGGRMGMPDESCEDRNGRMGMPDESFEDPGPGETCSVQTSRAAKPHELKKLAKGLRPAFGLAQFSKDSTVRTLRNGKVCGMSNGASLEKRRYKRKTLQYETSNMKVIPTEETTHPSEPTSDKNVGSVAQIPAADNLQSQDSGRRGKLRPRKKARCGGNI